MNIFLDSADFEEIKKWYGYGIINGVTTNPTLLSKINANPADRVRAICAILPEGYVSIEITEHADKALAQARQITALAPNVLVKIPCHLNYYPIIKQLVSEEIKLNITLVFSLSQALMMAKLGVTYISPFVGRLEDVGMPGRELIADIREMLDRYDFSTQICAASIRDQEQFKAILLAGAHTATVPPSLLEELVQHPLTDRGVKQFEDDWAKIGISQFP